MPYIPSKNTFWNRDLSIYFDAFQIFSKQKIPFLQIFLFVSLERAFSISKIACKVTI